MNNFPLKKFMIYAHLNERTRSDGDLGEPALQEAARRGKDSHGACNVGASKRGGTGVGAHFFME